MYFFDSAAMMDAIDTIASEYNVTCLRIFGTVWVGYIGLFPDPANPVNLCDSISLLACKAMCLAVHNKWHMTCALDCEKVTFCMPDVHNFDVFGQQIRNILNVVMHPTQSGIYVSLSTKKGIIRSSNSVFRDVLLNSELKFLPMISSPMFFVPEDAFTRESSQQKILRGTMTHTLASSLSRARDAAQLPCLVPRTTNPYIPIPRMDIERRFLSLCIDIETKYDFLQSLEHRSLNLKGAPDFNTYFRTLAEVIVSGISRACFPVDDVSKSFKLRAMAYFNWLTLKGLGTCNNDAKNLYKDLNHNRENDYREMEGLGLVESRSPLLMRIGKIASNARNAFVCAANCIFNFYRIVKLKSAAYVVPTADDTNIELPTAHHATRKSKKNRFKTKVPPDTPALRPPTASIVDQWPVAETGHLISYSEGVQKFVADHLLFMRSRIWPVGVYALLVSVFVSHYIMHERWSETGNADGMSRYSSFNLVMAMACVLTPLIVNFPDKSWDLWHLGRLGLLVIRLFARCGIVIMIISAPPAPSIKTDDWNFHLNRFVAALLGFAMEFRDADPSNNLKNLSALFLCLMVAAPFESEVNGVAWLAKRNVTYRAIDDVIFVLLFGILVWCVHARGHLTLADFHIEHTVLPSLEKNYKRALDSRSRADDAYLPKHTRDAILDSSKDVNEAKLESVLRPEQGAARESVLAQEHVPMSIVLAIHVTCMDTLSNFVSPHEFLAFASEIHETVRKALDSSGAILLTSFTGVYMTLIHSNDNTDTADIIASLFAVIRILQGAIEVFNTEHGCFVRLNYGADDEPVKMGTTNTSGGTTFDIMGTARARAFVLACNQVEGVCITPDFGLRIIKYQRLGGRIPECTFDSVGQVLRMIPHGFASNLEALRLQDCDYLGIVGRGGFGSVHLVKDKFSGEKYAVKVIPRNSGSRWHSKMLVREFRILSALDHENVLGLRGSIMSDTRIYHIMNYIQSGNLYEVIQKNEPSLKMLTHWFAELTMALEYLHRNGILHRDVKPTNCMITRQGQLKLCDFGLSTIQMPQIASELVSDVSKSSPHTMSSSSAPVTYSADSAKARPDGAKETSQTTKKLDFSLIQKLLPQKQKVTIEGDVDTQATAVGGGVDRRGNKWCAVIETGNWIDEKVCMSMPTMRTIALESIHTLSGLLLGQGNTQGKPEEHVDADKAWTPDPKHCRAIFIEDQMVFESREDRRGHTIPTDISAPLAAMMALGHLTVYVCMSPIMETEENKETMMELGLLFIPSGASVVDFQKVVPAFIIGDDTSRNILEFTEVGATGGADFERSMKRSFADIVTATAKSSTGEHSAPDASKELEAASDTREGNPDDAVVGTLQFMAPEIFTHKQYTSAVDWWAFGVTVYSCVTRRKLFEGQNRKETINAIVNKDIDLSLLGLSFAPKVRLSLQSMVRGTLNRDPTKRLGGMNVAKNSCRSHPFWGDLDFKALSTTRRNSMGMNLPDNTFDVISSKATRDLFDDQIGWAAISFTDAVRYVVGDDDDDDDGDEPLKASNSKYSRHEKKKVPPPVTQEAASECREPRSSFKGSRFHERSMERAQRGMSKEDKKPGIIESAGNVTFAENIEHIIHTIQSDDDLAPAEEGEQISTATEETVTSKSFESGSSFDKSGSGEIPRPYSDWRGDSLLIRRHQVRVSTKNSESSYALRHTITKDEDEGGGGSS
jgi:serine/threonine protein kinase